MNLLLGTLGASWAVIPEIYSFIAPQILDLYDQHPQRDALRALRAEHRCAAPDEIWVVTTDGAKTHQHSISQLQRWWSLLGNPVPLRIWTARDTDALATQAECRHFRELVFRLVLLASETVAGRGQLLLSLAGGRKTMSADLQAAAHVFGCDRLLHVVGAEPIPKTLRDASPEDFTQPLPRDWLVEQQHGQPTIMPLVIGGARRQELLDIERDGHTLSAAAFPLSLAAPIERWPIAEVGLCDEIEARERASSALLGNYLSAIARDERHENWRNLYRLPTQRINHLRDTPLTATDAHWLRQLPKADLHRHLGGSLGLDAQRQVARVVWQHLSATERGAALDAVRPLLNTSAWSWNWPAQLQPRGDQPAAVRSHRVAALLTELDDLRLTSQLWPESPPRLALKSTHPAGFQAYERPGELTGSAILQHPAAVAPYAQHLVQQAVDEGILYLELRGSPQKYLGGDGARFLRLFADAITAACAAKPQAQRPQVRFVVIVDRRAEETTIRQAVGLAVQAQGDFVVGLDLAGDERHTPDQLAHWFAPAFAACLPVTIHAGEGESAANIWNAAYHLHADRIGHGLTLVHDPKLYRRFRDRGICLELCPTSNREVVGFRDPDIARSEHHDEYPLRTLWDQGLALTLCTDNPGISRTNLTEEYLTAARMTTGITHWEVLALIKQGFTHAFLPSDQREALIKHVDRQLFEMLSQPSLAH